MTVFVRRPRGSYAVGALYHSAQLTAMVAAFAFLALVALGTFH